MLNRTRLVSFIRKPFTSIQGRLLGVFLINTLLTVSIVIFFNQWLQRQLIEKADNALLVSAAQIGDRIDEFNRSNKQVFNVGARLPSLVDFLKATDEERADQDFRDRTRVILDSLEIAPWDEYYVLSQALLDSNGRNILDTATSNVGADESDQAYFRGALLGGSIMISPIQYRPERRGIYFYYALPVRENDVIPNTVIGVLRIQLAVASIQNVVFDSVRGQDLNIAIFDENLVRVVDTEHEDLLFRSIASYSTEEIAALRSQYALPPLPDDEVSLPVPGLAEHLSHSDSVRVVSGYTAPNSDDEERMAIIKLKTVPWYLVASKSTEQYFQPVQQQTRGLLALTLGLVIIALASSYFISRYFTNPIRALTAVAEQIADGTLHVKAPVTSGDEVGTLARTFNLMIDELETARATLEERVKQRTQELSETNTRLTHEMSERERYEKQALDLAIEHERRRVLSDFIQKASHEFRTPLSIINTNSYVAQRFLPADRQRHMIVINEQSKYIEGLINRMVLMARLDSGFAAPTEPVPIDELLRIIHASRIDSLNDYNAQAQLDLRAAGTWVCANRELLSIAVQNILDNSLKYAGESIEIAIKSWTQNEHVCISIADNGIGIPAELHTRVFERFFRMDEAHTTRGFGLGLPIARRIIENTGGTIRLESAVGQGTTVTITLAISPEDQT